MPDTDVMGEFFEDDGLAWQGTVFGHVYRLPGLPKRKPWTREDEENYNLSMLATEYLKEYQKGFDDE